MAGVWGNVGCVGWGTPAFTIPSWSLQLLPEPPADAAGPGTQMHRHLPAVGRWLGERGCTRGGRGLPQSRALGTATTATAITPIKCFSPHLCLLGAHGEGLGAVHGWAQPHVAIYIEFIYIQVRQPPRPRHRYVHKAKCKYLNALNTELKKRSLHNTARGPTRRQHDGTARSTHTQCPPAPHDGAVGCPGPQHWGGPTAVGHGHPCLTRGPGSPCSGLWGSGSLGAGRGPCCPMAVVPQERSCASIPATLSTRPRRQRRGHCPACPPRPRRQPAERGCHWGSAALPTG